MIVHILPTDQSGIYQEYGARQPPAIGEVIQSHLDGDSGLRAGEYEVRRVVHEIRSDGEAPRITCIVEQTAVW